MAKSFSFNGVDMSAYGLRLRTHDEPFSQQVDYIQLLDRAYGLSSISPPRLFPFNVAIDAPDFSTLVSYQDNIKRVLGFEQDRVLKIDSFIDRYWIARCTSGPKRISSTATKWEGTIEFTAFDPYAYANDETSHDHTIY